MSTESDMYSFWPMSSARSNSSGSPHPSATRVCIAFTMVYVLWGSTYLGIRVAVEHIAPLMVGASRFLASGLIMLAACALVGRSLRITRNEAVRLAVIGVLLLTGGNVMVAWSEQYVSSGLTALIVASVPLWVMVINSVMPGGDRLSPKGVAGLALGIAGMVVLLWPRITGAGGLARGELAGSAGLVFASASWALGSVLSRRWQLPVHAFVATAWEMTFAGAFNLLLALAFGQQHRTEVTMRGSLAIAYLVVFGSLLGLTAYVWLLEHVPTQKVATYAYVNPVVAVFLGWLVLNETVDRYVIAGTIVIVAAVALVTTARVKPAREAGPAMATRVLTAETGAD